MCGTNWEIVSFRSCVRVNRSCCSGGVGGWSGWEAAQSDVDEQGGSWGVELGGSGRAEAQ